MDDWADLTMPFFWGEGIIFACSGLDGTTSVKNELVATTLKDEPGFRTRYPEEAVFFPRFHVDGKPVKGFPGNTTFTLVCNDAMSMVIPAAGDVSIFLRYAVVDNTTIAGKVVFSCPGRGLTVELVLSSESTSEIQAGFLGEGDSRRRELKGPSEVEFVLSCGEVPDYEFEDVYTARYFFFKDLPRPENRSEKIDRTLMKCFSVLKANIHSAQGNIGWDWSTPDRYPHRYAWLWDSAFNAIGIKYISHKIAENTILAVLSKQRHHGFIPHMMLPYGDDSNITQPPLLCWVAWHLFQSGSGIQFIETIFPKLVQYLKHLMTMDRNGNGLMEWSDGGPESGMDNSPRFDQVKNPDAVDLNSFIANELLYLGKMAALLNESEIVQYCRGKWAVLAGRVNSLLWNEEDGIYYDLGPDGAHVRVKTVASFVPMFAGIVPENRINRLAEHLEDPNEFNRPFPVSSVSGDEPSFCDDMWRGPVWTNYNYIIIEGLRRYGLDDIAQHITDRTIDQIAHWYNEEGVIFEYFDSEAKTSPRSLHRKGKVGGHWLHTCIKDYSWTAAVFAELVLRGR